MERDRCKPCAIGPRTPSEVRNRDERFPRVGFSILHRHFWLCRLQLTEMLLDPVTDPESKFAERLSVASATEGRDPFRRGATAQRDDNSSVSNGVWNHVPDRSERTHCKG